MKYLLIETLHPQIDDVTEKILDVYRRLKEQREPINIVVVDYQPELTKLAQDYRIDLDDIWQLADIVQRTKGIGMNRAGFGICHGHQKRSSTLILLGAKLKLVHYD